MWEQALQETLWGGLPFSRAQIEDLQSHGCQEKWLVTRYTTWMNALRWLLSYSVFVTAEKNYGARLKLLKVTPWPSETRTLLVFLLLHSSTQRFLTAWESIHCACSNAIFSCLAIHQQTPTARSIRRFLHTAISLRVQARIKWYTQMVQVLMKRLLLKVWAECRKHYNG